jgi:hypothetical protein
VFMNSWDASGALWSFSKCNTVSLSHTYPLTPRSPLSTLCHPDALWLWQPLRSGDTRHPAKRFYRTEYCMLKPLRPTALATGRFTLFCELGNGESPMWS